MDSNFILESWDEKNAGEIAELWNRNFPECYRTNKALLMRKVVNDADLFTPGTFVCKKDGKIIGLIATKISDNSLPEYQQTAWLSALLVDKPFRRNGFGSFFYQKAEHELKKHGIKTLLVAGEMDNFFSGIPNPTPESKHFFSKHGFVLNDVNHYDLTADVSKIDFDSFPIKVNDTDEFVTRPMTQPDIPEIERFFSKEFPGRWKFEIMRHIREGGDFNHVLVLCRSTRVIGFCKVFVSHNVNSDFNTQLGESWGSLGPIGISEEVRGMGLGNRILRDSLKHLKALGAHNVNIDWTVLKDFYGQFGFVPWRTYLGAYKEI